ncbi:MAG: threonylcarbamoyl-AMP synthase [Thermoleophilia bacterium]|nr:threonylcarbamoyl-AMP synthase [Thermoleophilia bacterium]
MPTRLTTDPDRAARALAAGRLVAFPTETVYGLGADAESARAVARVFAAKGRPADHPLIVHGADAGVLERYGRDAPGVARTLADALWPGPLTLLVRRGPGVDPAATGGRDTVGLRVPAHPLALAMLARFGRGVAAPSANRFGRTSPTTAAHVEDDLGDAVDVVLDGGPSAVGVESTILDLTGPAPVLLRSGGVPLEALRELVGADVRRGEGGPARAPGMLEAHYAPRARVEVHADAAAAARAAAAHAARGARVAVLGHVPDVPGTVTLRPADGAAGYARDLYRMLREADRRGADVVVAVPPPPAGLGLAVADRLRRAAAAG